MVAWWLTVGNGLGFAGLGLGLPILAWACRSQRCGGLFADFDFDLVILDDF